MASAPSTTAVIPIDIKLKLKHQFLVIRQKAIEKLIAPLKTGDKTNLSTYQDFSLKLLLEKSWQSKQSAFILAQNLIKYSANDYQMKILENAQNYFEYNEHRVREAVANCCGELANVCGLQIYQIIKPKLFQIINDNFKRDNDNDDNASGASSLAKIQQNKHKHGHNHNHHHNQDNDQKSANNQQNANQLQTQVVDATPVNDAQNAQNNDKNTVNDVVPKNAKKEQKKDDAAVIKKKAADLQHDTEGWKCLYSAMKTIERIIVGLGARFSSEVTNELLLLIKKSTQHINRFIREISYYTYSAICICISYNKLNELGDTLSVIIRTGLSDNWSQVRYASSHAVRNFFDKIPDPDPTKNDQGDKFDNPLKKKYFPVLLPAMCLNRYYVAAGVRVYSLESWKLLVGTNGRKFVAEYIKDISSFFTSQATADNHAVREAACHCIAELATKVDHNAVSKYIPQLLDALIACFKDASWPVRDAACVALGDFVSSFPDESVNDLNDLYKLWFEHLSDNIPSVREDSAIALGKILKCNKLAKEYGAEKRCVEHLDKYLNEIKKQKADTNPNKVNNPNLDDMNIKFGSYSNETLFGVAAKKVYDNNPLIHSGQQQYSCGSLAPKLRKATRSGCMDHGFTRDRSPWEYTDGCIHLLRELIVSFPQSSYYDKYIPYQLPNIASRRNFAHYHELQQTIWQSIPVIAESIGKRKFKMYLELLLIPMCETLQCKNRLAMNAAGNCIMFCNKFIGKTFFIPRLKPDQLKIIQNSQFVQL